MTAHGDDPSETERRPGPGASHLLVPLAAVAVAALVAGGASWAFSERDDCLPARAPALPAVGWDTVDEPVWGPSARRVTVAHPPGTDLLVEQWCAPGIRPDQIVTAGGVLFAVGRDDDLRALDATTGETWWSVDADDHGYYALAAGPVLVDRAVVVAGSRRGAGVGVLAFDQATGDLLWEVQEDGFEARHLVVSDGVLYASIGDYRTESVLAVGASAGTELWLRQIAAAQDETSSSPQVFGLAVADDAVVIALHDVTSDTGTLEVLERGGGTELWSRSLEAAPTAGPVVHDGQVTVFGAVGGDDSTVLGWSFDVDDGGLVWSTTRLPGEGASYQEPVRTVAATAGGLYALGDDLLLLDPSTGLLLDPSTEGYVSWFGGMTVAGDRLITCGESVPLGAVAGTPLGFVLTDGSSPWCPTIGVVANGVFYGVHDEELRAFG